MHQFSSLEKIYLENIKENKYYLEEQQWLSMAKSFNMSRKDFLFYILNYAKSFSQSTISNYKVGIVGIGFSNKLYIGTNIEFPFFPLNESIHAEQSLISLAYAQAEKGVKEIYLTAFPCGHCRQFFREMANFKEIKIFIQSVKSKNFFLTDLLPHSFGPQDLNIDQTLFIDNSNSLVQKILHVPPNINTILQEKIVLSLKRSFCPYSKNPSGIVLEFNNSETILGSYIESCAFNPSLSPFHMAYAQVVLGNKNIKKLKAAYFIEMENSQIKQENIIRALLEKLAPQINFYSLKAR